MQDNMTKKEWIVFAATGTTIINSWSKLYFNSRGENEPLNDHQLRAMHFMTPFLSIVSIAAGSYSYATNTPPRSLQQAVKYGVGLGSTIYTVYQIEQEPDKALTFVIYLIKHLLQCYCMTNNVSYFVEKFLADKVQMPIGNTDIQLVGGATSISIQWSSTDDPIGANLTGNTDESESTT